MPAAGHGMVVRNQVCLQNHNIRNGFDSEMSSASDVPRLSGALLPVLRGAVHKEGVERTAPLRP